MTSKKTWAARAAVLGMTATLLVGANGGSASALGSTCTGGGSRPNGPITNALEPLLGSPGYPRTPLGDLPFTVTALLDAVVCPVLP